MTPVNAPFGCRDDIRRNIAERYLLYFAIYIAYFKNYTTFHSPLLQGCTRGRLDLLGEGSDQRRVPHTLVLAAAVVRPG